MIEYESYLDINNTISKKIAKERDKIILARLYSLGIDIDIESESKRRFKRFVTEIKENEETIYFNDGSEKGVRIVTFVTEPMNFKTSDRVTSCNINTSYY